MFKIAITNLVIAVGVCACKDEGCGPHDPEIYCNDNVVYRCIPINDGSFFSSGPTAEYVAVIDCAKYGATCQEGIKGYIPRDFNSLMDIEHNFACVATDYDCDAGDPAECYNSALISCDVTPGVPVIRNTVDNSYTLVCK